MFLEAFTPAEERLALPMCLKDLSSLEKGLRRALKGLLLCVKLA